MLQIMQSHKFEDYKSLLRRKMPTQDQNKKDSVKSRVKHYYQLKEILNQKSLVFIKHLFSFIVYFICSLAIFLIYFLPAVGVAGYALPPS